MNEIAFRVLITIFSQEGIRINFCVVAIYLKSGTDLQMSQMLFNENRFSKMEKAPVPNLLAGLVGLILAFHLMTLITFVENVRLFTEYRQYSLEDIL